MVQTTIQSETQLPATAMVMNAPDSSPAVNPYVARIDELRCQANASPPTELKKAKRVTQRPRVADFFVTVFAFGLTMNTWAYFQGHDAAWLTGWLFSVVGIFITLFSLFWHIQVQQQTIHYLAESLDRNNARSRDTRSSCRIPHLQRQEHAYGKELDSQKASA